MNGIGHNADQAEKMLLYEQERDLVSLKYSFSAWEEMDYEEVKFREILTSAQFENYISGQAVQLKQIEESLIEHDKQYLPQLNAAEERLLYYRSILVPSLCKNLRLFSPVFNSEREKINFLKAEYKKYFTDSKKRILVEHFRHSTKFQPVLLKLSLLQHEQMCLLPDYFYSRELRTQLQKLLLIFCWKSYQKFQRICMRL
jgi:hypothetical protein